MSDPVLPDEGDVDGPIEVRDEWLEHCAAQARSYVPLHLWQVSAVIGGKISGEAFRLWMVIASHARSDGRSWPSNARLAAIAGGVTQRTVQRWLSELRRLGWLDVNTTTRPGSHGPMTHRVFVVRKSPKVGGDARCHPLTQLASPHDADAHHPPPDAVCITPPLMHTASPQLDPSELAPDEPPPLPEGRGAGEPPRQERADPAASLWGRIQDALAEAGCPIRGAPSAAHQGLYSFFRQPGFAPDPEAVVRSLRRDAKKWVARAADERAAGSPDPWRFAPALARWIKERHWEIPDDPEPPGPPPTVSVPGVSRRELDAREEDMRRRREATARARGAPVSDLPRVDMPRSIGDSVKAIARRKGLPS